jgi:hypothetical protein
MGEVYRARDPRLRRDVAIKVIAPEAFRAETLAAAALNHPQIVAVYDVGANHGSPYLVTELLDGESLRHRLAPAQCQWKRRFSSAFSSRKASRQRTKKGSCTVTLSVEEPWPGPAPGRQSGRKDGNVRVYLCHVRRRPMFNFFVC